MSSEDETDKHTVPGYPYGYRVWPPAWPAYAAPYGYPSAYPVAQTVEAELNMLESYRERLEAERDAISEEIEEIEARIKELNDLIEAGEPHQRRGTLSRLSGARPSMGQPHRGRRGSRWSGGRRRWSGR